ncbi:hypothetical protein CL657_00215 [bacterium]|nr:hypothetical protein [bacterium]|tara:strand:+ start:85 stop:651 length:567 start_codon:yes stop_codon:yes gene_type:complete
MSKSDHYRKTFILQDHYNVILDHANVISTNNTNKFFYGGGFLGGIRKGKEHFVYGVFPVKKQYLYRVIFYKHDYIKARHYFSDKNILLLGLYYFRNSYISKRPFDRISYYGLPWLMGINVQNPDNPILTSNVVVVNTLNCLNKKLTSKISKKDTVCYNDNLENILNENPIQYKIETPEINQSTFKIIL